MPDYSGPHAFSMAKTRNWKQSAALLGISGDIWTPRQRYERASICPRPFPVWCIILELRTKKTALI
jgi:hypothetical protein